MAELPEHSALVALYLEAYLRASPARRHDQHCRLEAMGIPPERMALVRDPSPVQFTGNEHPLPVPAELKDRIVLLYSGNWGIAHDVTFVEGYLRHHREGSGLVGLWLNAVGSGADQIEGRLPAHGLPVARTRPLPLADLPRLLVTPHAHLITLKDSFVGYVLPSKVYACIASGRPILFVGSAESDVHLLCAQAVARLRYNRVSTGDAEGVRRVLEILAAEASPIQSRRLNLDTPPLYQGLGGTENGLGTKPART